MIAREELGAVASQAENKGLGGEGGGGHKPGGFGLGFVW